MKIGIFDSGLGGLQIMRGIVKTIPRYDYLYLGDTERVPYGNRSQQVIYEFARQGVDYLLRHGCALVIIACNTASAQALRRIQREYLPKNFPNRRVLGVIIPTVEAVAEKNLKCIGVIGTVSTIESGVYPQEIKKLIRPVSVYQQAAPLLVAMVESGNYKLSKLAVHQYLQPLLRRRIQGLVLGCTHYPILKKLFGQAAGKKVKVFSQDEIIPKKLKIYLDRHPEISRRLDQRGRRTFLATDITKPLIVLARRWFGRNVKLQRVFLDK